MRKILAVISFMFMLAACNNHKHSTSESKADDNLVLGANVSESLPASDPSFEQLLGSYVGPFGDNKITILITRADTDSIGGRSIVGGNDRPFAGTVSESAGGFAVFATEPGDDTHDGTFKFTIHIADSNQITGSWTPYDKKKSTKEYTLQRKKFEYRPDVGTYPFASQRLLKTADVENEMKEDLEFMRNEIFARHGYCFKRKHLRQQFENEEWYVPNTVDIKGFLTDIEKKNIALIKRYEKYADEYGDEYGR